MKCKKLRLHPKRKSFFRGGYWYNPVIDKGYVDSFRGAAADCLLHMVLASPQEQRQNVGAWCAHRARLFRMGRESRVLLIKHERKKR